MRIRVVATAASSELCSHSLLNLKNTKTLDGHCTITFFFLIWSEMSWCRWRDEAQRIFSWLCLAANCRNSRQQPDRVVKLYVVCVCSLSLLSFPLPHPTPRSVICILPFYLPPLVRSSRYPFFPSFLSLSFSLYTFYSLFSLFLSLFRIPPSLFGKRPVGPALL